MIRKRITAILSLAAILAVAPSGYGRAATATFSFFGSGFGHGVGMSQWGAYGLAVKGWTHQEILTQYYSGTTVDVNPSGPGRIRVGLVDGVTSAHLTAVGGPVALTTGSPGSSGTPVATIPAGATYLVKGGSGNYVILNGSGTKVAPSVDGSKRLYVSYHNGAMVRSPEAGHTYNRGFVEFEDYQPCSACGHLERMIAVLSPQAYLYGLGEVPASWPMQAMEAQADAGRTYAEYLISVLGQHRAGCDCGVYDDTRNQVYAGWDHEGETDGSQWDKAVDQTAGEVVLYQGKLIEAQYMSSSGGYTETSANVWGGDVVPYLRGVCDPGDFTSANPARVWKVSLSASDVTDRLRPYTGDIGTVLKFRNVERGVSGRVLSLTVVGSGAQKTIGGTAFRNALGLMDDRVWINHNKNVTGAIRATYDALDCRPGLQTSTKQTIPGGYRQRFDKGAIYRNVQASRTVWLHGPIYTEYVQVKEASGPLGLPVTRIVALTKPAGCSQQVCQKARFDTGVVLSKPDTGAHEVHGAVLAYYLSQGGALGHLGFPMSDVVATSGGGTQSTFQGSPGGSAIIVTCDAGGSCSEATPSRVIELR